MDVRLLAGLPAEVLGQLRSRGAELAQVAALVDWEAGEPVLLTGSYATGEANPTSDLDLLVLTRRDRAVRAAGMANHPSLLGDSFDGRVGDLVVNVEYVPQPRLAEVGRVIAAATSGDQAGLPNLQSLELRLVHRVTTGVVLTGEEQAGRCRALLDAEVVRASAAAMAFLGALSLLEDTTVLPSPEREVMCRAAAESLLLAAVNAFGPLTYDGKHLLSRAAALARPAGAPRLFAERNRLIFADRLPPEEGLAFVLDLAEDLYRSFTGGQCPPVLLRMLGPFRSSWSWSDRAFSAPGKPCAAS